MKQNGQWLSQVCTRSNTALASSSPSGAPAGLSTRIVRSRPPRRTSSSTVGLVGLQLVADDVAKILTVDGDDLVAREQPRLRGVRFGGDGNDTGRRHDRPVYGRMPRFFALGTLALRV